MVIKINYTSSDIYVSTNVSPVYVVVNYSTVNNGGGGAIWGGITGTLSDQTDLQTALDAKFDDPTGTTAQYLRGDGSLATFPAIPGGTVTSVGLTMPSAFSVANSPVTSSGTLAVTGAGTADQYVRGDGQLANFPTNQGGGSSVNYYLNGSVNQGTFGGDTYYEMSKTPIIGSGTNFTRTNAQGNGYIASFITDAGDPALLNIPGGNWNLEFYFAASSSGSTPSFYAELYKVSSSNVFTLISSGSTNPEGITNGTVIDQYFTSIPVPQTSLLATDRLAIRIFVTPSGRTITLHTEDNNLCEVLTTFSTGLNALNGLTAQVQYFATGTSGTDFAISSATDTHTFNLPTASASNRGALSSADWTTFSGKVGGTGVSGQVAYWNGTNSQTGSNNLFWDNANARLGIGTNVPTFKLDVNGTGRFQDRLTILKSESSVFDGVSIQNTNSIGQATTVFRAKNDATGVCEFGLFSSGTTGASAGVAFFYTNQTILDFYANAGNRMRIFGTGNVLIQSGGTFSDGGQRLQVQGDAFIKGTGSTSATTALLVTNSSGTTILSARNDGYLLGTNISATSIFATNYYSNGTGNTLNLFGGSSGTSVSYIFNTYGSTDSSVSNDFVRISRTYNPTSGTGIYNSLVLGPTINQTGGANGATRGLYINPTLTAAADWRSIEWSNNSGWGLYGAGTAPNFLGGDLTFGNNKGFILSQAGTNKSGRIYAADIADNFAGYIFYPSSGTNVGNAFQVIPRGTGFNATIKSQIVVFNTDFVSDSTNYELAVLRAGGTNYSLSTGKAGTGTTRPLLLSAGFATDAVTNGNQLWLYTSGRVGINTTSEGTFLLDVNGTARVSGYTLFGSGNSGTPLATLADFRGGSDVDFIQVARASTSSDRYVRMYANGQIDALSTKTDSAPFTFAAVANANTSGTRGLFSLTNTFNPTSGTATYSTLQVNQTINQTGGANGITRGLYINSTITAAADWRAIEVSAGVSVLAASTTASATLRIPSGTAPTSPVNGDIWFDGTDLKMRIGGVTKTFTLV